MSAFDWLGRAYRSLNDRLRAVHPVLGAVYFAGALGIGVGAATLGLPLLASVGAAALAGAALTAGVIAADELHRRVFGDVRGGRPLDRVQDAATGAWDAIARAVRESSPSVRSGLQVAGFLAVPTLVGALFAGIPVLAAVGATAAALALVAATIAGVDALRRFLEDGGASRIGAAISSAAAAGAVAGGLVLGGGGAPEPAPPSGVLDPSAFTTTATWTAPRSDSRPVVDSDVVARPDPALVAADPAVHALIVATSRPTDTRGLIGVLESR